MAAWCGEFKAYVGGCGGGNGDKVEDVGGVGCGGGALSWRGDKAVED